MAEKSYEMYIRHFLSREHPGCENRRFTGLTNLLHFLQSYCVTVGPPVCLIPSLSDSPLYADISSFLKKQFERDIQRQREREREITCRQQQDKHLQQQVHFLLSNRINTVFKKQKPPNWFERGNPKLCDTVDSL